MSSSYFNRFKSTEVRGPLLNSANGEEAAYAKIEGALELGLEATTTVTDPETGLSSQVYTNTGGEIVFRIQGQTYTLTREVLRFLVNVNADVQNQLDMKPSMNYVNTQISLLEDEVADKVGIAEYNDGMSDVYSELAEKAAATYVDTQDAALLSNINTRATTTQLNDPNPNPNPNT